MFPDSDLGTCTWYIDTCQERAGKLGTAIPVVRSPSIFSRIQSLPVDGHMKRLTLSLETELLISDGISTLGRRRKLDERRSVNT